LGLCLARLQRLESLEHKLRVLAQGFGDQFLDPIFRNLLRQGEAGSENERDSKQD
jgi:hypothetical protein